MRIFFFSLIFFSPLFCIGQNNKQSSLLINNLYVLKILENVKLNKKRNHPDNLNSYQYYIYNKFYIDDFKYNYSPNMDSIIIPDLNKKELLFLGERVTECKYDKRYGRKNTIIANKISGLKEPFYELFNEQIFQEEFPKIIKEDFHLYNFKLIDSANINQRKTYILSFGSKKNILLNGSKGILYIDASSFALVKYKGEEYRNNYTRYFEFDWRLFQNIWYLETKNQKIKFNTINFPKFFTKKYQKQDLIFTPWIIIKSNTLYFSNPNFLSRKGFKGYTYSLKENYNDSNTTISTFRTFPLNNREKQTYESKSSLFYLFPIEKKIKLYSSLKKGELPLGKFNFDISNLLRFSKYEGFRIQLGGRTNYLFNKNYALHGYAAFGSKDTKFKGSAGIDFFVNKESNGKLSFNAASDINPFSINITRTPDVIGELKEHFNFIHNPIFYSYKKGEFSYQQDFFKRFTTSFIVDYQTQKSNYEYSYKNNNPQHWFNQFNTSFRIKYAPFAEYMQTPAGRLTIEDKPIHFYFNYTKGWKGLNTDFEYHKFDISSDISIKNAWGTSNVFINSGYISGKTTLWNLYGSFGDAKTGSSIFNRISVKGFHSFETLAPGYFFADKYAAIFFSHSFNTIKLWGTKNLYISLVYNGMIGDLEHENLHSLTNFQVPKKYYQEVGIEFNKLISYLGLGIYYRIGTYNQNYFEDNLFIKINLTLF